MEDHVEELEEVIKAVKRRNNELEIEAKADKGTKSIFYPTLEYAKMVKEEFDKKNKTFEKEVKVRIAMENKLNTLHAHYRDLNSQYLQACKELEGT